MNSDDIVKAIKGAFPQLPEPRLWEKNDLKRFYFNKKEGVIDYTFYIDINNNEYSLGLKSGNIWHKKNIKIKDEKFVKKFIPIVENALGLEKSFIRLVEESG